MRMASILAACLTALALLVGGPALAAAPSLELQVELDPGSRHLKARALIAPASRNFHFELHDSLLVTAASADGKALSVVPAGHDGAVRNWRVLVPAKAARLQLDYEGTLPALDRNLDHRGVLRGLPPMASAAGSFLPAGGAWYPQPAPLFTYRVALSVPADQRALVPGRLESEVLPADGSGRYRASFAFALPADGIDLMAGPWVVRERIMPRSDGGPVRLRTYFSRDLDAMAGLADSYLDDTRRYLERYGKEIGAYPFTEFSVVASPLPTGFGMPTLTYLGAEVLKLPFIRGTSLGHEVLHNWWGNGVYPDYAKGNWSEGLTTFMADYAYKEDESAAAAREMRLGWLRDFAAVPASAQQSLASFRSRTHGAAAAVGYGKAAMLFFMLRDEIGEDAFRRGLRAFWVQKRFKLASWNDLKTAFEQASGKSLETFFDQWVNRAGGPRVQIVQAQAKPANGRAGVVLTLVQSAPAYALRLPIEIVDGGRSATRRVDSRRPRETITIDADRPPEGVRLDPDLRVWRFLEREQLPPILRQWIIAPSPRLAVASASLGDAAQSLAQRLFEAPARPIGLGDIDKSTDPLLLAGLHADVDAALARAGLPPRPARLAGRGSAQVWTIEREAGAPLAVVSAQDADALQALLRPLPHYGSQSWLVFDGSRAVERGVWPAPGRLIPVPKEH
ncbi:MAG: putative aminopeptidase [Rhodocyclaceae bacterium]|nr:putative aminopeptidase [Rhodocyclaceae bacterium]